MKKPAIHRWICVVSGLLAAVVSLGGPMLGRSGSAHPAAQRHVVGQALTLAVLSQRAERRGPQISARADVLPLVCDSIEDDESDGSERLVAPSTARLDSLPCPPSAWAVRAGGLLYVAAAPLAHVRLQI